MPRWKNNNKRLKMEIKKVKRYGTSKVALIRDYELGQEVFIMSFDEYHNLIQGGKKK